MNIYAFNVSIATGWLMFLAGSVMLSVPAGLVASGLLLLVLVFAIARISGIYQALAPSTDR